ncbi:hypothetical protein [Streptomyces sp. NPDC047315]|uniref:hypothetical protein n=1 Tax=Streptomyces sp. NPDC047315 TaxID=3155142 RepID=UPI0033F5C96B
MTNSSGDQFTISVGRDASGPLVAGHKNRVEVNGQSRSESPEPAGDDCGSTQKNVAKDNASLYTVQNGELHVHHEGAPREATPGD